MSDFYSPRAVPRRGIALLGARMQLLNRSELTEVVLNAARSERRCIVANHNLHSLYLLQHDPRLREFFDRATWTHVDGMPIIALARRLGFPAQRVHRVTYLDWAPTLLSKAREAGLRVFYLGSRPGVAARGVELLRSRLPGLQIEHSHGYFDTLRDGEENQSVVAAINAFEPHILMVGMGMPRQERWILDNLESLEANVILPSGAFIDYVAGEVPNPPRWMGRVGLEWLFRLCSEPRRLAFRYLVEPWSLLPLFLRDYLDSRRR